MLPEGFRVVVAQKDADPVLRNLFEFYLHDMAEWFRFDQLPSGNYTHDTAPYWMPGRKVHLLYANDVPIGFGLTQPGAQWSPEQEATDMEEFFVVRRHRRSGIGREFAEHLWRMYPGPWVVRVFQDNRPALPFWRRTVDEFSGHACREEVQDVNGRAWSYFHFVSIDGRS